MSSGLGGAIRSTWGWLKFAGAMVASVLALIVALNIACGVLLGIWLLCSWGQRAFPELALLFLAGKALVALTVFLALGALLGGSDEGDGGGGSGGGGGGRRVQSYIKWRAWHSLG